MNASVKRTRRCWQVICLISIVALPTVAGATTRIDVFDRRTHEILPTYFHHGRTYVAGEPGHEYELRIHSDVGTRTLAVTSIDGVNVISGETATPEQSGYVLDPYGFVSIEGWRKSLSRTAAFYFTNLGDSYAARTGRPDNVGVIGVAIFHEREVCCVRREDEWSEKQERSRDSAAAAPAQAPDVAEPRAESKLGTGHGRSEYNAAQYTQFQRASSQPDEVVTIYYDSRRNLVAQGIIAAPGKFAERLPRAFPGGFTPDP